MASYFPALDIKPGPDVMQQMQQAFAVKNMIQQGQQNAINLQIEQRQLRDQDALTRAFASMDFSQPGALATLPQKVLDAGGSGEAAAGATKMIQGMQLNASTIAKNDAATALDTANATQKQNDAYRGRILSIVGIADPQEKQAAWQREVLAEETAGTIKPGMVSYAYPGDQKATALANSFAAGSVLVQEAQTHERLALEAWKPAGGQLVNTLTGERIGGIANIPQLNSALQTRWQVLHPGQALPPQFTLQTGATPDDFKRIDSLMGAEEQSYGTKAQRETANAIRQQTFEMQRDKSDMQAVEGTDPKTGKTVLVPMSVAQQMGIQDMMKAPEADVSKALAARHWLVLAQKTAPDNADPAEMGIWQLVNRLDREGKLGPLASRWNNFMAGTFGVGDPEYAALRSKMGLSTTLLMQAHVGNRGSAQMLEHFEDLANEKKLDGPTLKADFGSEINYITDRAMDPNPPNYQRFGRQVSTTLSKGAAQHPAWFEPTE